MQTLRPFILGCLLGLACALVAILLGALGALDRVEGITYDMRVRALAPSVDVPIKVIVIDDSSLNEGRQRHGWTWPWNRSLYGYVVSFCRRAKVKSLAVDMIFTEHSSDVPADNEYAEAVGLMPNFVGALLTSYSPAMTPNWVKEARKPPFRMTGMEEWHASHPGVSLRLPSVRFPYDELTAATPVYGHVRGEIEGDSVVRRSIPLLEFDGQPVPRLAIAAWLVGEFIDQHGSLAAMPPLKIEGDTLHLSDRQWKLDKEGAALLSYYRPKADGFVFETYRAYDIIASEILIQSGVKPSISPDIFKDCHILIGASASALYDLKPSPFSPKMPGVELQATTLANLIRGDSMSHASPTAAAVFAMLWAALVGGMTARGGRWWQLLTISVLSVVVPALLGMVLYHAGLWWPIIMPMLAAVFALTAAIVYIYTFENRQRRFIRAAFARYLSDEVIQQLVTNPKQLELGGEERVLSIFFSDIENFSGICEELSPTAVTKLLNEVLTEISSIVLAEGGTLDKYVGDAVVAFWNAPTAQPDHAERAVRAALRCQRVLAEKEDHFKQLAGGNVVRMRIGLHTGEVLVGNLGSRERFDYSILGDAANLASRLEGANKAFGTRILVSGDTWALTHGKFHGRSLGKVSVVGKQRAVEIVHPLGFIEEPLPAGLSRFALAITLCREGNVNEAIESLASIEDDPTATALIKYLKSLDAAQKWDGIWRLSAK